MASARKPFNSRKPETVAHQFAEFIADLLSGAITASAVHVVVTGPRVRLEYDDPNGPGQAQTERSEK